MDYGINIHYTGNEVMCVQAGVILPPNEWAELAASKVWARFLLYIYDMTGENLSSSKRMDFSVIINYDGFGRVKEVRPSMILSLDEWCELAASVAWQDLVVHLHNVEEEKERRRMLQEVQSEPEKK